MQMIKNEIFDYFVVDGLSTDGSVEFLSQNIFLFKELVVEKDNGIYDAMNKGLRLSNLE